MGIMPVSPDSAPVDQLRRIQPHRHVRLSRPRAKRLRPQIHLTHCLARCEAPIRRTSQSCQRECRGREATRGRSLGWLPVRCAPGGFSQPGTLLRDVQPVAADRTAPGQGGEARPVTSGWSEAASRPDHRPDQVAWLLLYPDAYEVGLPNQGLQILYEILNERDDAVAERAYVPWTDLEGELRANGVPLFSVDTHLGQLATSMSSPSTCQLSSCTQTSFRASTSPASRYGQRSAHPSSQSSLPVVTARSTPSLSPTSWTRSSSVTAKSRWGDHRNGSARGSAPAALRAKGSCGSWPRSQGCTSPRCTPSSTTGRGSCPSLRGIPTFPRSSTSAAAADLADWPYPKNQLVPLIEVVHDRLNVEIFRGCTGARLPVLPGGHDHPAAAASVRSSRCARWCATACAARATTKSRSRRSRCRLLRHRRLGRGNRNEQEGHRLPFRSRCRHCASTVHRGRGQRDPKGPPHRPRLPRPRPARGACAR